MFKFNDLSGDLFNIDHFRLSPKAFFEKYRFSKKAYIFDLRSPEEFEESHLTGAHNLPIEHLENSIYELPFSGDILFYGSENEEVLTASEIMFDSGFDTFNFTDSYKSLIGSIDSTYMKVSEEAEKRILEHSDIEMGKVWGLKIQVEEKSLRKVNYILRFIGEDELKKDDFILEMEKFKLTVSKEAAVFIEGTGVMINENNELEARNPQFSITKLSGSINDQIQQVLDDQVNPMVANHGGVVRLMEVRGNNVYIQFGGGCQGCGMIDVTLKQSVEVMIKEQIPDINEIYDITEHGAGIEPYYHPSNQ